MKKVIIACFSTVLFFNCSGEDGPHAPETLTFHANPSFVYVGDGYYQFGVGTVYDIKLSALFRDLDADIESVVFSWDDPLSSSGTTTIYIADLYYVKDQTMGTYSRTFQGFPTTQAHTINFTAAFIDKTGLVSNTLIISSVVRP